MMALRTEQQIVAAFGLPSPRTVRTMRDKGLPAVKLGKAYLYDPNDVAAYIEQRKVSKCPGQTEARISNSSNTVAASTSTGAKTAQLASDQQALRTAEKLKQLSHRSSQNDEAPSEKGHVIPVSFPSHKR